MRIAIALLLVASAAHAQPYDDPETEKALKALDGDGQAPAPPTQEGVEPPPPGAAPPARAPGLALAQGHAVLTVTLEASLSKGSAFEPTSIAPDISYGVTDQITASIVHSGFATTGFRGSAGSGICFTGKEHGCGHVYNNVGGEVLVDLVRGPLAIAGVGGVHVVSIDDSFIDVKAGASMLYRTGKLTATFAPSALVGVTKRDEGNKGTLFLPASIGTDVKPLFLALGGGIAAPLDNTGDSWTARIGVIGRMRVSSSMFVAASFFLPKVAGGDAVNDTGADARTLNVWVTYVR
jgi:hypothetical protein